ncbi:pyridoxamine 5'-phosphate oxidase family protein [Lewinella sp. JB7]|uniref:pyridoxamine 5'-phosphate oxidase family protein n=1 Tax=Lewinella sp. JB7 TaxID=2962887 RepID=UPI0020C96E29|nr:pyridoxamine 5'-phosphate oxidase family protein [Lewinella sp. JB7]MCP9237735.1 pyridoxamine 5'-phosphate oxidase family protein [Lewinella sp. JB7]
MSRKIKAANLWKQAWNLIFAGLNTPGHPFGTPSVATCGSDGVPRQRTLVLRNADRASGSLRAYTDNRSIKMTHLAHAPRVASWLFWDPESRIQLTASGPTLAVPRTEEQAIFQSLPKHSRRAYATELPPGTPTSQAQCGLPATWDALSLEETDYGEANFRVLETRIHRAEVLQLDRDGNVRLVAHRSRDDWALQWVVP